MKLLIHREVGWLRTFGKLYVDGMYLCHTLEDMDRKLEDGQGRTKVPGETAIPRGTYKVTIDDSVRFKRRMLHVLDVPHFDGVRIHGGNSVSQTHGCPLVGTGRTADGIYGCREVLTKLERTVQEALNRGEEVTLEIR